MQQVLQLHLLLDSPSLGYLLVRAKLIFALLFEVSQRMCCAHVLIILNFACFPPHLIQHHRRFGCGKEFCIVSCSSCGRHLNILCRANCSQSQFVYRSFILSHCNPFPRYAVPHSHHSRFHTRISLRCHHGRMRLRQNFFATNVPVHSLCQYLSLNLLLIDQKLEKQLLFECYHTNMCKPS